MQTILDSLRQVIGVPSFYSNGNLDIGLAFEYFVCAIIVVCVICNIFRLIRVLFGGN